MLEMCTLTCVEINCEAFTCTELKIFQKSTINYKALENSVVLQT